ncbi:5'-nucleotidase, lipoprotein e(P4) family [Streptococcus phocae subsp. salmonis]|uniref:5'-nucleotidase, lipoprotein e(P4) family n=1 Tax=Streptococcus phocae TaxID=119224 RepID=UPI000531D9D7|nr:5'-nucleotidase, lipoprotein e(P4) family [Streptococcus phocae]KGR72682.1 5'-nucleotidase [Streptococcus phocae subsp. salmonis]
MKSKKLLSLVSLGLSLVLVTGCSMNEGKKSSAHDSKDKQEKMVRLTNDQLKSKENTMSVLWYQQSEEAKALYLQGYQVARQRLDTILGQESEKPYSIVLDIDETVLDNSPYQAKNIKEGTSFTPDSWDVWVQKKSAKPVAGAKEFLTYANEKGVQIYYVSDRTTKQVDPTMENLEKEGLPVQGKDHFLFYEEGMKSKESRRQKVLETTNLVMLFGDNLVDFAEFSKTSRDDRKALLEELHKEFGNKFIIFPNPMYGSWESSVYNGKKLDSKEQLDTRDKALEAF